MSLSLYIPLRTAQPEVWYKRVQVYSMVALAAEDANRLHITVNGLWNGYFGGFSSPFAFGRRQESSASGRQYSSDREFVEALHQEGFLVPATILTSQGRQDMQGEALGKYACRSYDGALPDFDLEAGSFFMCANNPVWINWMINHGKRAIDAGADLIVLDEIQGNSFFPKFQWFAPYLHMHEPGFCPHCIEGFRAYLRRKYTPAQLLSLFKIADLEKEDLASRIASTMHLPYPQRRQEEPLTDEYIEFQTLRNFEAKKKVIKSLREYARSQGKQIPISANIFALGSDRGGGYWVKGLIYADLLDFLTFENTYTAVEDSPIVPFPRNKWVGWEKLARAMTNSRFVLLPDTGEITRLVQDRQQGKTHKNYLAIHFAEAYAMGGAFAIYYIYQWGDIKEWEGCSKIAGFVLKNREIYEAEPDRSEIALVLLYGQGLYNRFNSYLGLAQALYESSIPFDVVFGGGGRYLRNRLSENSLKGYRLIFVPSTEGASQGQIQTIKDYVRKGGVAIVFDAEPFGLSGKGAFPYGAGAFLLIPTWEYQGGEWDIGNYYYLSYDDEIRKILSDIVEQIIPGSSALRTQERKVVAYPYYYSSRHLVAVHLINYDHALETDSVKQKENLVIRLEKPSFSLLPMAVYLSPDGDIIPLAVSQEGNFLQITVPRLSIYGLVVIGRALPHRH